MKVAVLAFLFFVSLAATCAMYGWLESTVNMIEGLTKFFQPGSAIIFSPLLVLFILLGLAVFVGVTLLAVTAAAIIGGAILRSRGLTISQSIARYFLLIGAICIFVFAVFASQQNAPFLLDRPRLHPNPYLAAFIAAANAALGFFMAATVIRKQTSKATPPPLP